MSIDISDFVANLNLFQCFLCEYALPYLQASSVVQTKPNQNQQWVDIWHFDDTKLALSKCRFIKRWWAKCHMS